MKLLFPLLLSVASSVLADPITLPRKFFNNEDFRRSFVGSYGFLPTVEPKVDGEESRALADLTPLFDTGKFSQAESQLSAFIRERKRPGPNGEDPKGISPALIQVLGNLYAQNGRDKDAERSYKLALKAFPKFRRALKSLAFLLADQERFDEALPYLQQAVELGDADQRSFGLMGFIYLNNDNPVGAEIAYRQALLLAPTEKDWKFGLATSLMSQEKWTDAVALLNVLIKEEPDNLALWRQLANVRLAQDKRMEGAQTFEVLRKMGELTADELNILGNVYVDQGQPVLALGAYLESIKKADKPDIKRSLEAARILVDYGAPERGLELLNEVEKQPNITTEQRIEFLVARTKAAKELGNEAQVAADLEGLLALDPSNGVALIEYGELLERRANDAETEEARDELFVQAKAKFRAAMNIPETEYDANLRYGQMQVRRGQFVSGLGFLEKAGNLKPSEELSLYVRRVKRAAARQQAAEDRQKAKEEAAKSQVQPTSGS